MQLTYSSNLAELPRLAAAAVPATIITMVLLLTMFSLIRVDAVILDEPRSGPVDVVMDPPPEPVIDKPEEPVRPQDPQIQPEWVAPQEQIDGDDPSLVPIDRYKPVVVDKKTDLITSSVGIVAYLKVQPDYPSRAVTNGLEGFVDLAFDITPTGSTANIRVIEAQPEGIFEKAAIRALRKWKYKVPVEDGVPKGQKDMMTRITFTLESG